jgi:hypothetical protein
MLTLLLGPLAGVQLTTSATRDRLALAKNRDEVGESISERDTPSAQADTQRRYKV